MAHANVLNKIINACPTEVTGKIECATAFDVDYVLVSVDNGVQDATACPLMVDVSYQPPSTPAEMVL